MNKTILLTGIAMGILAIVLGAFGAHGLKKVLTIDQLASFETGVKYQMYHAIFLMVVSQIGSVALKTKSVVFYLTLIGVICFSFSIYLLTTTKLTGIDFKKFALITPIGGTLLIGAWAYLFWAVLTKK